ncbi:unnamed protein product, partial [Discosporangium mesarthrocarpum]
YHPEYKSRPGHPSPLFSGLILAAERVADGVVMQEES